MQVGIRRRRASLFGSHSGCGTISKDRAAVEAERFLSHMSEAESARSTVRGRLVCAIGLLTKDDWLVVGWVLAVKFLLFVFGAKSYQILEDKSLQGAHAWFEIWNRWDSLHFQRLAQFGYSATDTLPLGFVAFPETRPIRLQRDGHDESLVLSAVSLVSAAFWSSHGRLSSWRIRRFGCCFHSRRRSSTKTGQFGLSRQRRARRNVVLFDLSDGVFFTHWLYGEPVSRAEFGVAYGGAHGTLVAGRCARGAGLDDARTRCHSVSYTRRRSVASILGRAPLEMAVALDRARTHRFRRLFNG